MFPMIATIAQLRDAKAILAEEAGSLGIVPIPCGIMVEIPAVAVMADVFADEADFFSIGPTISPSTSSRWIAGILSSLRRLIP
jgi:phosphocarrier protein FPr